jgi:hypothetical protein
MRDFRGATLRPEDEQGTRQLYSLATGPAQSACGSSTIVGQQRYYEVGYIGVQSHNREAKNTIQYEVWYIRVEVVIMSGMGFPRCGKSLGASMTSLLSSPRVSTN